MMEIGPNLAAVLKYVAIACIFIGVFWAMAWSERR